MPNDEPVLEILREAKKLAQRYRAVTGKPLGITGEVAEYEAAHIGASGGMGVCSPFNRWMS